MLLSSQEFRRPLNTDSASKRTRKSASSLKFKRYVSAAGIALVMGCGLRASASDPLPAKPHAGVRQAGMVIAPLAVNWKFTGTHFANNPAGLCVSGDNGYFATGNRVFSITLANGGLRWRYPTEGVLPVLIQTTPTYDKGTLYFGAGDGLYAIDSESGKMKWHYFLKSSVSTSPVVVGNTVFFGSDGGRFYAVNTSDGAALKGVWSSGKAAGVSVGADMTADFIISGDTMYYITSDQVLHSASIASGTQRWAQRLEGDAHTVPVLNGESIYMSVGNSLGSWRTSTGQRQWAVQLPASPVTAPAVDENGTSYVVTSDRMLYAVDIRGRGVWRKAPQMDFEVIANPIVSNNLVIIGTAQGGLYAYDKATGVLKWSYIIHPSGTNASTIPQSSDVVTAPIVAGNQLYVLTDDGTVTAFSHDVTDGQPPVATVVEPKPGESLSGRPPFYISARVQDEGSGVNLSTLTIKLDDMLLPRRQTSSDLSDTPGFYYNPDNDTIDYATVENEGGSDYGLKDGHHTVTLSVMDWYGNAVNKTWSFFTDDTLPKRRRGPNNGRNGGRGGFGGAGGIGGGAGGGKGGRGGE